MKGDINYTFNIDNPQWLSMLQNRNKFNKDELRWTSKHSKTSSYIWVTSMHGQACHLSPGISFVLTSSYVIRKKRQVFFVLIIIIPITLHPLQ